jgi:hypothetical protein
MMPLVKVTDMRFSRSIVGRLLGYGEFRLESAGQDQALGRIPWVADPDATYRELCAIIFTPQAPNVPRPVAVHRPTVVEGRPAWPPGLDEHTGDTQPIRIPRPPTAHDDDEPGWAVSGDVGTFVPVHRPERHPGERAD